MNGPRERPEPGPQLAAYDADRLGPHEAALLAARACGCSCEPDIKIKGVHATIRHDAWCVLMRREDRN